MRSEAVNSVSPFLEGAFSPVHDEVTSFDLPVTGRLPEELDGLFTQIGPTPLRPPKHRTVNRYTWFTQDGMVSGVRIQDGRAAWFRNRWVRSNRVARTLGERRTPGPRHFPVDTVNTNVIAHNGLLLALVETGCLPARLGSTLDTVEYTDLGGQLRRGVSAHPKLDPDTGELHLLACSPLRRWADYLVLGADGTLSHQLRVPLRGRPLIHDIALTSRHVVFFNPPVQFAGRKAVRESFPYRWQDGHPTRLGVLPRPGTGGQLTWFDIPDCFVFHTVGAHEPSPGHIELTAIRYDRLFDSNSADPLAGDGHLWRWSVDLDRGTVTSTPLGDRPHELPRSDPRLLGRPLRHYYAVTADRSDARPYQADALLQHDFTTGEPLIRRLSPGHVTAEPVFVPQPRRTDQDAGWIAYFEYDPDTDTTSLIWLDAADLTGPRLATVTLPIRVPLGCHCSWINAHDISRTDLAP